MTKKRKIADEQSITSPKVFLKKAVENSDFLTNYHNSFDNDASTSGQIFDSRKSYLNFIKDEPRKLRFLRRRTLVNSVEKNDQSAFVTNWYTSVNDDPNFHTLSTNYPTKKSLIGYSYHGEKEVDRLNRFFELSKRNEDEIEDEVQSHRNVQEDLIEAQRLFDELSNESGRLAAMGSLADKVGWRQMPSILTRRLHEDSINQTFETAKLTNAEIKNLIRHESLDWMDNYDIANPPGKSILSEIEDPRFGIVDPPISCCIFTNHRNGQISRCLREPTKAFNQQLCAKVVKKSFPFCWDKKVKIPAICTFHTNIIEKEPKNTEFNPFFERALGKHEKIEPVKFTEKSQYNQLGKFIDFTLQKEKDEHAEAMGFDLRLLKLLEPPKTNQAMQEIRNRQIFDNKIVRNGKSADELEECYEKAWRRRNELKSIPKCPYKNEESDDESEDLELPLSLEEWLTKQSEEPGPSSPLHNSLVGKVDELNDDERTLYKATEFGLLEMNESPVVEAAERYRSLLDVQGYDEDTLRVFGAKQNSLESPRLNFDAISAASIRRIKKFYNLANRSGATSKTLLMEGLGDYFENKPVDEFSIAYDFIKTMNERQRDKRLGIPLDNKMAVRKPRQQKKIQISTDIKYETMAESSSTSTTMPFNNLTVVNLISTVEHAPLKNYTTK